MTFVEPESAVRLPGPGCRRQAGHQRPSGPASRSPPLSANGLQADGQDAPSFAPVVTRAVSLTGNRREQPRDPAEVQLSDWKRVFSDRLCEEVQAAPPDRGRVFVLPIRRPRSGLQFLFSLGSVRGPLAAGIPAERERLAGLMHGPDVWGQTSACPGPSSRRHLLRPACGAGRNVSRVHGVHCPPQDVLRDPVALAARMLRDHFRDHLGVTRDRSGPPQ